MARKPVPWFWKARNAYYVTIDGVRHRLDEEKMAAEAAFYKLMAERAENPPGGRDPALSVRSDSVWGIFELFLNWTDANRAKRSYEFYEERLRRFKDAAPNMRAKMLKPYHVQEWLDKHPDWSAGYKRGVVTALKRAFNWAVKQGRLERNPIQTLEKPEAGPRDQIVTQEQFQKLLSFVQDEPFRDLLQVVWLTGCRPQEICRVEATHLENGYWKLPRKKSKGGKYERLVFMPPKAEAIVLKWAKRNPEGPIFRNNHGRPWTAWTFNTRFTRLQKKLGCKIAMYALRHSFAHHALTKQKMSPEVVAALLGHTSTATLYRVYGHLLKDTDFMRNAAKNATGGA